MIGLIAAGAACLSVVFALWRFLLGPSLYDRALAAHVIVAMAALAGAGMASAFGQAQWVDLSVALILALFVFDIALLKFTRLRSFQPPLSAKRDVRR
jgi:multisubunit Na+/H+ antiporter MnhF subunit